MANPPPRPPPNSFLTPKQDINIDATSWGFLVLQPGPFHELSSSSSIVKLLYLKGKGDKEHEQLVFEVKLDPDYRHPNIFVTTDRCPKTFESQPSTPLPSLESKRTEPVPVSVSSDSLSGPFKTSSGKARADDRVFIKGSHRGFQSTEAFIDSVSGSYDVIGQWGFETPIPLSHAAIAMACVTGHSLYYEPLNHQCYWYADNVLSLLLKQRPSACKDEYFRAKQGKYLGINIRQRDSLPALTQEYGEKWESYKKDGKLFMEEETRKLDEYAQARVTAVREEEQCRREKLVNDLEEEQRRRGEEQRRREEEQRRREEAEDNLVKSEDNLVKAQRELAELRIQLSTVKRG